MSQVTAVNLRHRLPRNQIKPVVQTAANKYGLRKRRFLHMLSLSLICDAWLASHHQPLCLMMMVTDGHVLMHARSVHN